jgi:hypothetical protein
MLCRRSRSPLADALSRGLWRMLCRRCRFLFADVSLSSCGCFTAGSLADALPPCRYLFAGGLSRVSSDGCFAVVLVVQADALPPYLSPCGGSFATAASSPELAVLCVGIPCRSSRLGGGGGGPSPYNVFFSSVFCSQPLSLWFVCCAMGFSIVASCMPFIRHSHFFLMKYTLMRVLEKKRVLF